MLSTPKTPSLRLAIGALALALTLPVTSAVAQQTQTAVGLLRVETGGAIPAKAAKDYEKAVEGIIRADDRALRPISTKKTRELLLDKNPALAGCETEECLKRAGQSTGLSVGVVATASGEAQIYDFEVTFFDLTTGKASVKEKGSCEICTNEEALKAFKDTASRALTRLKLPEPTKTVDPPVEDPPKKDPPKKPALTTVDIVVIPQQASLSLGDLPLGTGTATRTLKPGKYTIRANAEGFEALEAELVVTDKASGPIMLRLQMAKLTPEIKADDDTQPDPQITETVGIHKPGLGWTMLILGGAAVGGGAYLLNIDGRTTCAEGAVNECPNVFETTAGGTSLLGVGALSAGVGLVLIILDAATPTESVLEGPPASEPIDKGANSGLDLAIDPASGSAFIRFGTEF